MKTSFLSVGKYLAALTLCVASFPANATPTEQGVEKFEINQNKQKEITPKQIFADKVYSKLKSKVSQEDINQLKDPQLRDLATQLLQGTYDTKYRVADYECFLSYVTLSELWNAPGKHYDQMAGVTGINFPAKSTQTVIVNGIPKNIKIELKTVAWYVGKIGHKFDGGNPKIITYPLHNGVNTINYKYDWDGLAYICYYAKENPEKYKDIRVHFVNGEVNGYLTPEQSNTDMKALCAKAPNTCMDVVGKKVHSVWSSKGLEKYCRANNGDLGYRQFMNVLDSLIAWEHRQLGLEKYDRIPKNRTMAYVNYTYYMFQGGLGVSFHVNQEPRVLNCKNLIDSDHDAIWGLSHEWGHQHQMHPYFCWAGMSEVSNNVQSYHNIMKMGYRYSDKIQSWPQAREIYLHDKNFSNGDKTSNNRLGAYKQRKQYEYSPKMYALCESMKDNKIAPAAQNRVKAVAYAENNVGVMLTPLIMLHNYFTENGFPNFAPDWYEALRQNDDKNGSQIEKKGKVDKYELIASAQNNNKNNKLKDLRKKYPESCWVKDNYITEKHCNRWHNSAPYILNFIRKTSRLTGYNLTPFFEQWGYLRQVALEVGDYGQKYYVLTADMYDEFKVDMDALVKSGELKEMPEGMIEKISNAPEWFQDKPTIAN